MATDEQERQARDQLKAILALLSQIDPQSLDRRADLGTELSFEPGMPYFNRLLGLFRKLYQQDLSAIPHSTCASLYNLAQQQLTLFNQIKEFSHTKYPQNTINTRNSLISQIVSRDVCNFGGGHQELHLFLPPWL